MSITGELADAIMVLSKTANDGCMDFGYLEMYANAIRSTEGEVEDAFEDALELLERDGRIREVNGEYYDTEVADSYEDALEDAGQALTDEMQSYHFNVWRS